MSKVMIMDHPLVQHKVSIMRSKNTGTKEFKELVSEVATLLCYEATRDLPTGPGASWRWYPFCAPALAW